MNVYTTDIVALDKRGHPKVDRATLGVYSSARKAAAEAVIWSGRFDIFGNEAVELTGDLIGKVGECGEAHLFNGTNDAFIHIAKMELL